MNEWQNRPLDAVYPFIFLDAIHYKIRDNHTIVCKAAYVVLGVNLEGNKDILGIWVGEHESAKFWMGVLSDLKTRGVKDIFLCCVDGLTGFSDAIGAMFPVSDKLSRTLTNDACIEIAKSGSRRGAAKSRHIPR
jgi:transposase-like protein